MARLPDSPGSWCRRALCTACALCVASSALLLGARASSPQSTASVPYRIFLNDGAVVVSYGEYARAGDRVVFNLPLGPPDTPTSLQLVGLPATVVDWERTDRQTDAVRYEHYVSTRGEADYAALTAEVAHALTEIAFSVDPMRRLTIALQARQRLLAWPRNHFGYRASDAQEMVSMLEESVSSARAAAGQRSFDLSLVAASRPPVAEPLPDLTVEDSIRSALAVLRLDDVAAERLSLQQSILLALERHAGGLPAEWTARTRTRVAKSLQVDLREERAYADLAARVLKDAGRHAAEGDVRGVLQTIEALGRQDAALGRRRPQEIGALFAAMDTSLETARTQRLAIDRYRERLDAWRVYRRDAGAVFTAFDGLRSDLDAIKTMAGPRPSKLRGLTSRVRRLEWLIAVLEPPGELRDLHAALASAMHLVGEAVRMRQDAVASADLQLARNASTAAGGAEQLLAHVKAGVDNFFRDPRRP